MLEPGKSLAYIAQNLDLALTDSLLGGKSASNQQSIVYKSSEGGCCDRRVDVDGQESWKTLM